MAEPLLQDLLIEVTSGQVQARRERLLEIVDYLVYHDFEQWDTSVPDALHLILHTIRNRATNTSN